MLVISFGEVVPFGWSSNRERFSPELNPLTAAIWETEYKFFSKWRP